MTENYFEYFYIISNKVVPLLESVHKDKKVRTAAIIGDATRSILTGINNAITGSD